MAGKIVDVGLADDRVTVFEDARTDEDALFRALDVELKEEWRRWSASSLDNVPRVAAGDLVFVLMRSFTPAQ
jgi:hypothetical protein